MDYKVIIILLVLLFLIILVYREVTSFREQIGKTINNVLLQFSDTNDRALIKFQNNINKCVSQIKTISSDNIQQLRKINTLNHQQIIRTGPNHFTEIDNSEGEGRTDIQHFSDCRANKKDPEIANEKQTKEDKTTNIFEKKEACSYYMSDDTHKKIKDSDAISEDAERSSKLAKQKRICDGNKCYIKKDDDLTTTIPVYNPSEKEVEDELPIYVPLTTKQIIDNDSVSENNSSSNSSSVKNKINNKEKNKTDLEKSILDNDSYTCDEVDSRNKKDTEIEIEIDVSNIIKNNDNKLSGDDFKKIIQDAENIQVDENIYIDNLDDSESLADLNDILQDKHQNENNEEQKQQRDETDVLKSTEESFNADQSSTKIDMSNSIKNLNNEKQQIPFEEQIEKARKNKKPDENTNHSKSHHSQSKMSRMSKKSGITIVTNGNDGVVFKNEQEDEPVKVKNYNVEKDTLKNLDEYTIIELKEIAKNLAIPTTYKDRNKTRQYKKNELYDNIKQYFDQENKEYKE